jgi:hypothetical protein
LFSVCCYNSYTRLIIHTDYHGISKEVKFLHGINTFYQNHSFGEEGIGISANIVPGNGTLTLYGLFVCETLGHLGKVFEPLKGLFETFVLRWI